MTTKTDAPVRVKPAPDPIVAPQREPAFEPERWCPRQVERIAPQLLLAILLLILILLLAGVIPTWPDGARVSSILLVILVVVLILVLIGRVQGKGVGGQPLASRTGIARLSPRELQVLHLMALAYTDLEISRRLDLGLSTITSLVKRIYTKLGIKADGVTNPRVKAVILYRVARATSQ